MRILSLGSGSKGNATVVEHDGHVLLIDCGLPLKLFRNIEADGVLLTHSHADHTAGLEKFVRHRGTPVYANALTAEVVVHDCRVSEDAFVCFEDGQSFEIGSFSVTPFAIPHDTSDPVGYLVRAGGVTYFHGTDIGTPLESIGRRLAEADVATLESNHDSVMLRTSGRTPSLIQRIAGPRGHLSNDQACDLVRRYASPHLRKLALAHLSRDCNAPHLALERMKATLLEMKRDDIELKVFCQDEITEL